MKWNSSYVSLIPGIRWKDFLIQGIGKKFLSPWKILTAPSVGRKHINNWAVWEVPRQKRSNRYSTFLFTLNHFRLVFHFERLFSRSHPTVPNPSKYHQIKSGESSHSSAYDGPELDVAGLGPQPEDSRRTDTVQVHLSENSFVNDYPFGQSNFRKAQ